MASQRNSIKTPRKKSSFGSCHTGHINPEPDPDGPDSMNLHISFEEALKLHFGLGQALAHLNSYDRREGKHTCVNLCVFPKHGYITINESRLRRKPKR